MNIKNLISIGSILLIVLGCGQKERLPEDFVNGLEQIKADKAPDPHTNIFQVDSEYKDGHWIISGESSVAGAETAVRNLVRNSFKADDVDFSFTILPSAELADTTHGIVRVSVANLRQKPRHKAEMVDQVLMGMELKLLKKDHHWYQVQTPYDYIGWITAESMQRMSDSDFGQWQESGKVTLNVNYSQVFSQPSDQSQIISDAVLGNVLKKGSSQGSWTEVIFPDTRRGFLLTKELTSHRKSTSSTAINREKIIDRAKKMMGIPYLWGGHSTKAYDCSGFTSTVFLTQGYQLPRDAYMQAQLGEKIIPAQDYSNIKPGDLIFFGSADKITHVGICLGGSQYIHESGDVHISSLDPDDELYDSYRKNTFRFIKRIIRD